MTPERFQRWKEAREIWDVAYNVVAMIGWIVLLIALATGRIEVDIIYK